MTLSRKISCLTPAARVRRGPFSRPSANDAPLRGGLFERGVHGRGFGARQMGGFVRPGLAALLVAAALAGCATTEGAKTSLIDGRRVEFVSAGSGAPTVVFENGLGGSLDWWAKVIPTVSRETQVFAYDRPGTGGSDAVPGPRDGDRIVEELRRTLRAEGIAPPYILVGHSVGGLYVQLFARRYPREIAGLVLVDSTHPRQLEGAGARENWPAWANAAFSALTSEAAKAEMAAIPATGAALLALPPLTGKPVIVLSASGPMRETSPLARDSNAKRADIVRLNPGARQVWVDSGHGIPLERPEAVIAAIEDVLSAARSGSAEGRA
ncbi:MAG: alpha/beta hydrolase [Amaricoccus sp.]